MQEVTTAKLTRKMLEAEQRLGKPIAEAMADAYAKAGNLEAAAKSIGIPFGTFCMWMVRLGITIKKDLGAR